MKIVCLTTLALILTKVGAKASTVGHIQLANSGSPQAQTDFLNGLAQLQ